MPQLQVRRSGEVLRAISLEMRLLSLGRTPDNGLPLRAPEVAIRHAEINAEDGAHLLTTLAGEQYPTYVNGQKLIANQPHRLEQGDEVQIGPFVISYLIQDQKVEPARAAPSFSYTELKTHPAKPPLPTYTAPLPPKYSRALYTEFLPPFFQESELLGRYLKIFQSIWEPIQQRQDHIEAHFDTHLAPPQVLAWLAHWLAIPLKSNWPEARQRAWMREAVNLYRWRGTRYGLSRSLETVFGITPILKEDATRPYTLQVILLDSPDGEDSASREAITEFIQQHIPAHTLAQVEFVSRPDASEESAS